MTNDPTIFNKRNAPKTGRFYWEYVLAFGDGVTYGSVHENGVHIGAPLPPANGAANVEDNK